MSNVERRAIPDGRIRVAHQLSEGLAEALRTLKIDGLVMLNYNEINFDPPEIWIEYWFDKEIISEVDLRFLIENVVYENSEQNFK